MAKNATGALSKVVIGFESAFGTIATEGFEMPFVSSGVKQSKNKMKSKVMRGNFNPSKPSDGRRSVGGRIVVPICSISLWYWMKAIFNTLTTTGTGPYAHEFKISGTGSVPSITIEHQYLDLDTPQYFQYTGCMVAGFDFSVGDEGEQLMNLDIVGSKETISSSAFDAAPTEVGYSPLDNADAAIEEGGSTLADSSQVSCNVNMGLDTSKYVIGDGGYLGSIPQGIISVSGNLDFLFKDVVLLNKAKNSTESSIKQTFSAAADKKVEVYCPELQYGENSPEISGPEGILASLPYEAYYDDNTDTSAIVVTVTNAEAHA